MKMSWVLHESGVAEIVGSLVLMGVIGVGILIAALFLLSNPVPEKIPQVNVIFSYNAPNLTIHHNGGDTLQKDEYYLMVDGIPKYPGVEWSVGKDIELGSYNSSPTTVQVILVEPGGGRVLTSADSVALGMPSNGSILQKFKNQ
jgi:hypothetical protein